jgi:hypothetical protein
VRERRRTRASDSRLARARVAHAGCGDAQAALAALCAHAHACGAPPRHLQVDASGGGDVPLAAVAAMSGTVQELHVRCYRRRDDDEASSPLLRMFSPTLRLPALRRLSLSAFVDVPVAEAVLAACPQLTVLRLDGCTLDKDAAAMLLGKRGLTEALLRAVNVVDASLFTEYGGLGTPHAHAPLTLRSASLQSLRIGCLKGVNFGHEPWHLPALRSLEIDSVVRYGMLSIDFNDPTLLRVTAASPELRRLLVCGSGTRGNNWRDGITAAVLAPLAAQCARLEELHLATRGNMPEQVASPTLRDATFVFPALHTLVAFVTGAVSLDCPALTDLHLASAFTAAACCALRQPACTCRRRCVSQLTRAWPRVRVLCGPAHHRLRAPGRRWRARAARVPPPAAAADAAGLEQLQHALGGRGVARAPAAVPAHAARARQLGAACRGGGGGGKQHRALRRRRERLARAAA